MPAAVRGQPLGHPARLGRAVPLQERHDLTRGRSHPGVTPGPRQQATGRLDHFDVREAGPDEGGTILVTIAYHVPRNDALATVDRNSADAERHWTRYVEKWTAANHLRTLSSLAAAMLLTIALRVS